MKLDLEGLPIAGVSRGGLETCLEVKRWSLAFDLGRCQRSTVGCARILFTHTHMDHMGAVALHLARRALLGLDPPTYIVPAVNRAAFEALLEAWRELDGSDLPCRVLSVDAGESLPLGKGLVARVFASDHRAPCLGYHIFSQREKLDPRYHEASSEELARLRRSGQVITHRVRTSELAFCGDTRFDVIKTERHLWQARRLILECTFLDERVSVERAREMGHVHLDEIAAHAELFREVGALLLTHVSARYGPAEARELVHRKLPPWLAQRTQVFLPD